MELEEAFLPETCERIEAIHLSTDTELICNLRNLWNTKEQRHYDIDYPKITEEEMKETELYNKEKKYALVMYNVFKVNSNYFKEEEIKESPDEEAEFHFYMAKEYNKNDSNYSSWKYCDVGCRSKQSILLQKNDYTDEPAPRRGRPKKEHKTNIYGKELRKHNKKGRPKCSKNKSTLQIQETYDIRIQGMTLRKMIRLLKKPFPCKRFKADYKIGKVVWKKKCKIVEEFLILRKNKQTSLEI